MIIEASYFNLWICSEDYGVKVEDWHVANWSKCKTVVNLYLYMPHLR